MVLVLVFFLRLNVAFPVLITNLGALNCKLNVPSSWVPGVPEGFGFTNATVAVVPR